MATSSKSAGTGVLSGSKAKTGSEHATLRGGIRRSSSRTTVRAPLVVKREAQASEPHLEDGSRPPASIYARDMSAMFVGRHKGALLDPVAATLDRVRIGAITVETISKILLCSLVSEDLDASAELPRQSSADLTAGLQLLGGYMSQDLDRLDGWLDTTGFSKVEG